MTADETGADSEMVYWSDDDGSAANESAYPTFHGFGVRVPLGEDYVTESGQRVENRSDREMVFEVCHALSVANVRIAALEADNADLATLLATARDDIAKLREIMRSTVSCETPFATRAEAELVERAMPANALKHSR